MLLGWFGYLIVPKKKQRLKASVSNKEKFSRKYNSVPLPLDSVTFIHHLLPATAVVVKAVQ